MYTDWWRQQKEMHPNYTYLSNVALDIFSITPHGVRVEACFTYVQDLIGWRRSKTTGDTMRKNVIIRQFAQVNSAILAGDDPALDTTNNENEMEMKREADESGLHSMAKVHELSEMWQGSQNLHATKKESRTRNNQMTAVGYISDTEEILKASWSNFQHDGATAFKLSERSPSQPALSAMYLPGGRTQVLNVRQIQRINGHLAKSDDDSPPESLLQLENWLHRNGVLDNPNESEDNWGPDNESDMELHNDVEDPESLEQQDVSTTPNVPRLILPTLRSKE